MNTKKEITKLCTDCKTEFVIDSGDLNLYEKIGLEIPEMCFFCRLKQHLAFFPFGKFRKGVSDLSEENLSSNDGISALDLPDSIIDTDKNISTQALICPESNYRFNISPTEFEFHKNKSFSLPRLHFDTRILNKIKKIAVLKGYPYKCTFCENDINAYYPPEWNYQKIACEECYKQNIA